jgi:RNA polymerase sigma-70 factor (ECF subfamily)
MKKYYIFRLFTVYRIKEVESAMEQSPEEILEKWVGEYQVPLKRVCYLYLRDEALAEDAVQETFLKAYRHISRYRGEASEKTYLTRIAVNACRDMRRASWFRRVDQRFTLDRLPSQAEVKDGKNSELAVEVLNLPRKLREAVILYYYQNFDTRETAAILGISQPAVTGRLKRARDRLRAALQGGDLDE